MQTALYGCSTFSVSDKELQCNFPGPKVPSTRLAEFSPDVYFHKIHLKLYNFVYNKMGDGEAEIKKSCFLHSNVFVLLLLPREFQPS